MQCWTGAILAQPVGMTEMHAEPDNGRAAGGGAQLETVSVADVLARRVALEWFESVAIVAGLCSVLGNRPHTGVPPARAVVLTPDGTIETGPEQTPGKAALPRLLHRLLEGRPHPTPLRLLVLHAISSEAHASPAAFGEALAYYERPGRAHVIRAVRQRCFDTPVPEPGSVPVDEDIELLETTVAPARPEAPNHRRTRLLAAGMMMGAGALALVVSGIDRGPGRSSSGLDAIAVVKAVAAHVEEAGRGMVQAISEQLTADAGSHVDTVDAAVAPAPPTAPARRTQKPRVETPPTLPATDIEPQRASALPDAAPLPAPLPRSVTSGTDVEPNHLAGDEQGINVTNASVVPPRLLDPVRLPPWAQPVEDGSSNVIELHISDTGNVERVKMLSPAARLTDMMILSAAKTWMFEPASKGGRPVPYRLTLSFVP